MSGQFDQDNHPLSHEQSRMVSQFLEWTGSSFSSPLHNRESRQEAKAYAIRILARYQWDLQKALEDHLLIREEPSSVPSHSQTEARTNTGPTNAQPASPSLASSLAASHVWLILQFLWQAIWRPIEYLLTEPLSTSNPRLSIPYAEPFPTLLTTTGDEEDPCSKLLSLAPRGSLFHVIYIDSLHHAASSYCRSILLQETRIRELFQSSQDLLFYDLDVTSSLGWQMALRFNLTAFPTLALVRQRAASSTLLATRVLALDTQPSLILEWLQREKQKLTERSAATQLREEQESAYMRSLAIDRAKAEQKAKAEAERQRLCANVAKRRAELESERKAAIQAWQKEIAQQSTEKATTQRLSLRLPSGRRIVLGLALESCSLLALYGAFYAQLLPEDESVQEGTDMKPTDWIWTLSSHYPKRSFALSHASQSRRLSELALSDGTTLYAESLSLQEQLEQA